MFEFIQNFSRFAAFLPPHPKDWGKVIFSLCVSVHTSMGRGGTPSQVGGTSSQAGWGVAHHRSGQGIPPPARSGWWGGGGIPEYLQPGLDGGGGVPHPRSGRGVPLHRSGWLGYPGVLPARSGWLGGTPH